MRGENKKKRDPGRRETEPCECGSEERVFENPTREGRKEGREDAKLKYVSSANATSRNYAAVLCKKFLISAEVDEKEKDESYQVTVLFLVSHFKHTAGNRYASFAPFFTFLHLLYLPAHTPLHERERVERRAASGDAWRIPN